MQEAISKIQEEMEKFKSNPLAQVLGKYIAEECRSSKSIAESVIKSEKTLEDLAKHITEYARKKASNGMAMLPKEEVYGEALKFYGTEGIVTKSAKKVTELPKRAAKKQLSVSKPKNNVLEEGQVTFFDFGMGV